MTIYQEFKKWVSAEKKNVQKSITAKFFAFDVNINCGKGSDGDTYFLDRCRLSDFTAKHFNMLIKNAKAYDATWMNIELCPEVRDNFNDEWEAVEDRDSFDIALEDK